MLSRPRMDVPATRVEAPGRRTDAPSNGDVLITTKDGDHFLSIIPHPHRLSFSRLPQALEVAAKWAKANKANVWRDANGEVVRLRPDTPDRADDHKSQDDSPSVL
jgi:hypothetical protein